VLDFDGRLRSLISILRSRPELIARLPAELAGSLEDVIELVRPVKKASVKKAPAKEAAPVASLVWFPVV
jgi:hypothetical protein